MGNANVIKKDKKPKHDKWTLMRFIRKLLGKLEQGQTPIPRTMVKTSNNSTESCSTRITVESTHSCLKGNEKSITYQNKVNEKILTILKEKIDKKIKSDCQNKLKLKTQSQNTNQELTNKSKLSKNTNECNQILKTKSQPNIRILSQRDRSRLEERRKKRKEMKQRKRNNTYDEGSTTENTFPEELSKTIHSLNVEKYQLPIGARGFVKDLNRTNRFTLKYLPPNDPLPTNVAKKNMEFLFEKLCELNASLETLIRSYCTIVRSLIKLQVPANKQKEVSRKFPTLDSSRYNKNKKVKKNDNSVIEDVDQTLDRLTVKRLISPETRKRATAELEQLVEELNVALDELHVYYDDEDGTFDFEEYCESDYRLSAVEYNTVLKRLNKLRVVVSQVLLHYSDQVLELFKA